MGKLRLGESYNIDIVIKNPSNRNLKILGIKPSCNCTIAQKKFQISKKSVDTLKIIYEPTELGNHIENITIKSNTIPPFNNISIHSDVLK
jgi:hypothetical protein